MMKPVWPVAIHQLAVGLLSSVVRRGRAQTATIPAVANHLHKVGNEHGKYEQYADDAGLGISGDVDQRHAIP